MPNSKFFIGSYSGDIANRNANYSSCDWSSAVSSCYQPQTTAPVINTSGYAVPTNPYTYAKQPAATTSNYYAPLPIVDACTCSTQPAVSECANDAVYPDYPVHSHCHCATEPVHHHCHCKPEPECPVCPEVPVYPECPAPPEEPSCPCDCVPDVPTEPECPVFDPCQCVVPEPAPCATNTVAEPVMTQEAIAYASRRPRRRNRLNSANTRAQSTANESMCYSAPVTPMPKRKHCGCNCLPETQVDEAACQHSHTGQYIDTPDDCDCKKRKREKCFLYEKLKRYHRKGKTICDFLNDYDEETFYALIEE